MHLASGVWLADEAVSALCYVNPHPIPKPATWTRKPDAVTCSKCREIIRRNPQNYRDA